MAAGCWPAFLDSAVGKQVAVEWMKTLVIEAVLKNGRMLNVGRRLGGNIK